MKELIRYLIIGVLTTVVSLATYYSLTSTILNPENPLLLQAANIISWVAAVLFAYFANRSFVFQMKTKQSLREFLKFVASRLATLFLDMLLMFLLVTLLSYNDKIAKLIVQFIVIVANYLLSKLFVFGRKA